MRNQHCKHFRERPGNANLNNDAHYYEVFMIFSLRRVKVFLHK